MGQIQILSEVTANQIAAGEVIERPQSVIKELIENALDAEATQIDIHVDEGGLRRMVIVDNGSGMALDDAMLCFSRYATSKLRDVVELQSLRSFGFRGEALASIASVAKVTLTTRQAGAQFATQVMVEGGHIKSVADAAGSVGTRIVVEDLFYNVPARLKFVKSQRSETAAIEHTIRAATLSKQNVSFSLRVDGKLQFDARSGNQLERAIASLGEECRNYLFDVDLKTDLLNLSGYIVAPLVTRKDSRGIRLYVNGRAIEDRQLTQAIRVAYRTLLEVGRYPICALHINIDPAEVDVNVHPQKREVRFSDASRVQSHMIRLLSDFLSTTPWIKNRVTSTYTLAPVEYTSTPTQSQSFNFSMPVQVMQIVSEPNMDAAPSYNSLNVIGQVGNTFLILEGERSMIVLDQHAAHERVVFQRLKHELQLKGIPSQSLLFPIQMSLLPDEMAALTKLGEAFARYGFEIEPFGETHAIVKAVPGDLRVDSVEEIMRDALVEFSKNARPDSLDDMADHLCAQIACHSSIRAGQSMQKVEIQSLLNQLDRIEYGAHCPHGRPVLRAVSFDEMARWFHRS